MDISNGANTHEDNPDSQRRKSRRVHVRRPGWKNTRARPLSLCETAAVRRSGPGAPTFGKTAGRERTLRSGPSKCESGRGPRSPVFCGPRPWVCWEDVAGYHLRWQFYRTALRGRRRFSRVTRRNGSNHSQGQGKTVADRAYRSLTPDRAVREVVWQNGLRMRI